MSQTNSVSKKTGQPRFLLFMGAFIALWVAVPFLVQLGTNTAFADHGVRPSLVAQLTGSPIAEVTPRGYSYYMVDAAATPDPVRMLFVGVSNVNLPDGTELSVTLNSSPIGSITLDNDALNNGEGGHGFLRLSTASGDTVPEVAEGDTLAVGPASTLGSTTYLSGAFVTPPTPSPTATHTPHTPFPTPSHTPFPTPSHTPFPSPTGTPGPARMFAARLNGAAEVPPVATDARGCGFVSLNSTETQIRVNIAFRNLSSDVTAVTINGPASAAENGPVIFTLTLPEGNHIPFITGTFDVTAEQIADLRAGLWYMQVASSNNSDGEIRGQLNGLTPHGGHIGGGNGSNNSDLPPPDVPNRGVGDSDNSPFTVDVDGDGIVDIAQYYPALGEWYLSYSSDATTSVFQVRTRANIRSASFE